MFAASASPIPLYEIYRRTDGLSHADLALTAVAYFVAVMATLLVFGRLSNHLGRRPVSLAALALTAAGGLGLTATDNVVLLIAGRVLQGVAAGWPPPRWRRSSSTARPCRRPGSPAP